MLLLLLLSSQTACGQLQELRDGLDVPVCSMRFAVTEVCDQLRQFAFHIESAAIPLNESACHESMPKVLEARTRTDSSLRKSCP